jgi:capsular exopolysaccharide synthesis family protein
MLANIPVLCVVPHMKPRRRLGARSLEETDFNKPLSLARPQSAFAESFRALRTTLLLSAAGKPPKVLLVTSSVPGEGKTTTSINCAVALAQNRCRVLLVDADMRTGGLQERLAIDHSNGLSQCLAGSGDPLTAVVAMPDLPNLHILFAGLRPPAPAELLGSDQMRDMLEQWRNDYDYIVLDTPPVLALTDAAILASMSDGILLVVRTGVTRRQTLCRTRDLLRGVKTRTIGVILNDFDSNSSAYFAHYGYTGDAYNKYYGEKELSQ